MRIGVNGTGANTNVGGDTSRKIMLYSWEQFR